MRFHWALTPVLLLLVAHQAFAQDDAAVTSAYVYATRGLEAFEQGKPTQALEEFSRAYALVKLPSLAVYMARAQLTLGHYSLAAALYAEASQLQDGVGDHDVQQRAREEARNEREALTARMPRLVVQTPGVAIESVAIEVDGTSVPSAALAEGWHLDPGVHRITAIAGNQHLEQTARALDGHAETIVFQFLAPPTPRAPQSHPEQAESPRVFPGQRAMRNATWVSFGIGGAALAFSGTTAIWALVKKHDLDTANPNWSVNSCPAGNSGSDCREYKSLRTLTIVGFYTGLVGATTGTVLLLTTPSGQSRHPTAARLTPWVGLGSAGVQWQF